jgi:uncharacterized OB-fold protein
MKLERIVKRFYDSLEEGKIMGRKCQRCGAVEFPPVIACNTCSGTDMQWIEMSGNGKMTDIVLPGVMSIKPQNEDLQPYCFACVEMEEGSRFNAIVCGVSKKNKQEMLAKLPVPIRAKIIQREGYRTVVFDVATD